MDLNKITLSKRTQSLLYGNSLVCISAGNVNKENKIDYLGNNEKRIIFIVNDPLNKFLDESQWKFFNDLLNACQLTMADIALINFHHGKATYHELEQLNPGKLFAFGVSAMELDLPFNIPLFQKQNYQGQTLMLCPSLFEIQSSQPLKKQLWNHLRNIFNIQKQK